MSKRLLPTATLLLALLIVMSTATYAWFTNGDTVREMEYSIAKIDSSAILYRAVDDNRNGVPNLLEESITQSYYLEQYDFDQVGVETYALSEDSSTNMLTALSIENVLPTQRHTFKYALTNRSSAQNLITYRVQGGEYDNTALLSTLSFCLGTVHSTATDAVGLPQFGEKVYLLDYIEGSALTGFNLKSDEAELYLAGMMTTQDTTNHLDLWLQIEMESYEILASKSGFNLTREEYNALQGATVSLPAIYIYFEIVI